MSQIDTTSTHRPHISIVSPVYKAEEIVDTLVFEIEELLLAMGHTYEIILVDDRSPDNSWNKMQELAARHHNVKCIRLSRNFGQHSAIMAGLSVAQGDWIVVMDCDLQDKPNQIIKLYSEAQKGFDVVLARRKNRKDSYLKKKGSYIFSKIFSFLTDMEYDNEIANFGIYHQKVISSVLRIDDNIKFFPLFVKFVGFKSTSVVVEHQERFAGESSYSIGKLISLAFNTIISFSNKPLKLFVKFGLIISFLSFLTGLYYIYEAVTNQISVDGFSSIMVSIWFLSGVVITIVGITGIYVGKIFDQTKNRPSFIIDEII